MGDVKKDVEMMKRMRASGSTSLHVASMLDDFMVRIFKERIKKEHPRATPNQLLQILREELSYGRRDNL